MKGLVQMLVVLGILFLSEILFFSLFFNKIAIYTRHLKEADILYKADKIETYVRSFLSSLKLSLLQAIYDAGIKSTNEVWQSYSTNYLTADKIQKIKDIIQTNTINYFKEFLKDYIEYAKQNEKLMKLPVESELSASPIDLKSDYAYIKFDKVSFSISENDVTIINRAVFPEANVFTVFRKMLDAAQNFIQNNELGNSIISALNNFLKSYNVKNYQEGTISVPPKSSSSMTYCENDGEPTAEEVYFDSYIDKCLVRYEDYIPVEYLCNFNDVNNEIKSEIKDKMIDLQNSLSTDEYHFILSVVETKSEINPSCTSKATGEYCERCSKQESCNPNSESCASCSCSSCDPVTGTCDSVANCLIYCGYGNCHLSNCYKTTYYDCNPQYEKTCDYFYYAAAKTNVAISEAKASYAFWNYIENKMKLDAIKIAFIAISGNKQLI